MKKKASPPPMSPLLAFMLLFVRTEPDALRRMQHTKQFCNAMKVLAPEIECTPGAAIAAAAVPAWRDDEAFRFVVAATEELWEASGTIDALRARVSGLERHFHEAQNKLHTVLTMAGDIRAVVNGTKGANQ